MIQLAIPADARYCLSDVEIQRSGPSYTIDTVDYFNTRSNSGVTLFQLMGMDAFLEIHTWKSWRRLIETVQPVVVTRSMNGWRGPDDDVGRMDDYIRSRLSADYQFIEEQGCWRHPGGKVIHLLPATPVNISSSQVRQLIRSGKAVADLVPPAVNAYIEQKELYR
jgi:nicotinate-nucleotide adenylyltransferase